MGKVDPRVWRTRLKLRNAFIDLLKEHSSQEINIKDLTNQAAITRGTFYLHYKDKDDFIESVNEEILNEYIENIIFYVPVSHLKSEADTADTTAKVPVFSLLHIFKYIASEKDYFLYMLRENESQEFQAQMNTKLDQYIDAMLPDRNTLLPRHLVLSFCTFGTLGYVYTWLSEGMMYAEHYMANNLNEMLNSDLIKKAGLENFFVVDASAIEGSVLLQNVIASKG